MENIQIVNDQVITPTGFIDIILRDAKTGEIKSIDRIKNMFVTAGKNSVASRLSGTDTTSKGAITYCALGTSAVAPALSDTGLVAEVVRKLISVRSIAANVATFSTFFTTTEGNGTLREAGLFGDDASTIPGSGTLFCRAAINRVKTSNDTLSLQWAVTIG